MITTESFVVAGRSFPVRDLSNLRTARGPYDRLWVNVAALAVALATASSTLYQVVTAWLGVVSASVSAALAIAAFLLRRGRPRTYELWGDYRGMTVLLFSSDDEREYGQVTRAVLRAQERARSGSGSPDLDMPHPW
ncbi:DUF6232 family protein [Asanoa hainanensis]|uniref:DUF6232 family protein n=1 Tax=Asanoa hainanensis TaxID=560556 RepID=UPI00118076D7|nr:DUF6232 family protein [Asanoa hainanensis]